MPTGTATSDLTFFDNQMLQKGHKRPLQRGGLNSGPSSAPKFANPAGMGPQFLNKTGPIKLSHHSKSAINTNISTASNTNQVDDILGNGSTDDIIPQQRSAFSNTQKVNNSLTGLRDDDTRIADKRPGGTNHHHNSQKPSIGSRRELNEKQPLVSGQQLTRPGTAPQQINAIFGSQQQQERQTRPLSPFDKVYKNNLTAHNQLKKRAKPRSGAILVQNGVGGMQKKASSQRPNPSGG